jgi:hypothetical protein
MNNAHAESVGMKQRVVHEIRRLGMIFACLALVFLVFWFYTRLVLSEYQINHFEFGLTPLITLALAKIILPDEALRFGERFRERPLRSLHAIANDVAVDKLFALDLDSLHCGRSLTGRSARGRDAADVALTTTFGMNALQSFRVWTGPHAC